MIGDLCDSEPEPERCTGGERCHSDHDHAGRLESSDTNAPTETSSSAHAARSSLDPVAGSSVTGGTGGSPTDTLGGGGDDGGDVVGMLVGGCDDVGDDGGEVGGGDDVDVDEPSTVVVVTGAGSVVVGETVEVGDTDDDVVEVVSGTDVVDEVVDGGTLVDVDVVDGAVVVVVVDGGAFRWQTCACETACPVSAFTVSTAPETAAG